MVAAISAKELLVAKFTPALILPASPILRHIALLHISDYNIKKHLSLKGCDPLLMEDGSTILRYIVPLFALLIGLCQPLPVRREQLHRQDLFDQGDAFRRGKLIHHQPGRIYRFAVERFKTGYQYFHRASSSLFFKKQQRPALVF